MNYKSQNGLTLLELSVVLLILTALAGMAVPYINSTQDIAREQITKDRALAIKNAIIKVDTINGVPTATGFAVDVGRLPYTISELTDGKDCSTAIGPNFNCANIIENWKGPYLNTIDNGYFDGWGTQNISENIENPNNFGWGFTLNNNNSLEIKSMAPQSQVTINIYPNDWSINLNTAPSITVNLIPPTGYCQSNSSNVNTVILPIADQATCVRLPGVWSIDNCSIKEITKEEQCTSSGTWKVFNPSPENSLSAVMVVNGNILITNETITSNQTQSIHFSAIPDQTQPILLPAGQRDVELFITDEKLNPLTTDKLEIINGNLSIDKVSGNKLIFIPYKSKKYLSLPRYIQTFNWN